MTGCKYEMTSIQLPERKEIEKIIIFSISDKDRYHGLFDTASKKEIKTVSEGNRIDDVYRFILEGQKAWSQLGNGLSAAPAFVAEFHSNSERVMMLWFVNNEISILTKPITPKNPSVTFKSGGNAVHELRYLLGV